MKVRVETNPVLVSDRWSCEVCDGAHGWIGEFETVATTHKGARARVLHCTAADCRAQARLLVLHMLDNTIDVSLV